MARAIPVNAQSPSAPVSNGQVVNGLLAPGTDQVIPPTNYTELGRLVDEGDLTDAKKRKVTVEVPLKEREDGTVPVMSHKAWRKDH